MAYVPEWEQLASALKRVMDAGLSRREAQNDICLALADQKIGVRPSLELVKYSVTDHHLAHRYAREIMKFVHDLREGINRYPEPWELHRPFSIPADLRPRHLNWSNSHFKRHWSIPLRPDIAPFRWLVSIELASADVTNTFPKSSDRTFSKSTGGVKATLRKSKRGRPPEYAWPAVKLRLDEYRANHGAIQTMVELIQKCADFASETHPTGRTPSDKTIREAIEAHGLDIAVGADENPPGKSR
jgi:hypothetical protein